MILKDVLTQSEIRKMNRGLPTDENGDAEARRDVNNRSFLEEASLIELL